ncbi:MAG: hypothetical protein ACR2NO_02535 [Chloroflexota bacterium]
MITPTNPQWSAVVVSPPPVDPQMWEGLVLLEPRLAALLTEIESFRPHGARFCANDAWYGYTSPEAGFKAQLEELVGWDRVGCPEGLRSGDAYDVAYDRLYDAFPDCRGCGCFSC